MYRYSTHCYHYELERDNASVLMYSYFTQHYHNRIVRLPKLGISSLLDSLYWEIGNWGFVLETDQKIG